MIVKRYKLRKEVKDFLSDLFLHIIYILAFIGIVLSFMIFNILLFG